MKTRTFKAYPPFVSMVQEILQKGGKMTAKQIANTYMRETRTKDRHDIKFLTAYVGQTLTVMNSSANRKVLREGQEWFVKSSLETGSNSED